MTVLVTKRRRNLSAGDHGVKHHGATFNLTDSQASKIQKLTRLDILLYDRAKIAFANQVKDIEEELDIVRCQNLGSFSVFPCDCIESLFDATSHRQGAIH